MKSVIVTGANGFIGSSLIKVLIDNGVKVTAIDVNFSPSRLPECDLITKIQSCVDLSLKRILEPGEYDAFYHLAWRGVNGSEKSNPYVQLDNIKMGIDCANVCRELGVKKLLCAGTVAENATFSLTHLNRTSGGMMYGVAKHACHLLLEDYCKNIGLPFVWMQFSNIYGIGNKTGNLVSYTLTELLSNRDATFGPALQPYDFIFVDDLIKAIYRLGKTDTNHSFYFIGSGCPRLLKDYLINIGEITNKKDLVKIGLRDDDGIRYSYEMFDNSNLIREIGQYVSTSFEKGIEDTSKWLKIELAK